MLTCVGKALNVSRSKRLDCTKGSLAEFTPFLKFLSYYRLTKKRTILGGSYSKGSFLVTKWFINGLKFLKNKTALLNFTIYGEF